MSNTAEKVEVTNAENTTSEGKSGEQEFQPIMVNKAVLEKFKVHLKLKELQEKRAQESKSELWDFVHEQYPELDRDKNYSLDTRFIESEVVMLKQAKDCGLLGKGMAALLGAAIAN